MLKDKRYLFYHLFTAFTVSLFLAVENLLDTEYVPLDSILLDFVIDIPVFTVVATVLSFLVSALVNLLNKHYPWRAMLFKRFIIEVGLILLLVGILTTLSTLAIEALDVNEKDRQDGDFVFEILAIIMFFITLFMLFAFHEFMKLSNDNVVLEEKTEDLEQQNYVARFEVLKHQINPHFLFNSLNVLSSLIYKDTDLSDRFITRFSEVFRYILELNNEQLVPLKRELQVLDSYIFLQKIRYGDNLNINQKIDAAMLEAKIPPMTLQITIENAIKHNVISKENPLHIQLFSRGNQLVIENNYQIRDSVQNSTKIGQSNLMQRYKLLGLDRPEFFVENDSYIAVLPLVQNHYESADY